MRVWRTTRTDGLHRSSLDMPAGMLTCLQFSCLMFRARVSAYSGCLGRPVLLHRKLMLEINSASMVEPACTNADLHGVMLGFQSMQNSQISGRQSRAENTCKQGKGAHVICSTVLLCQTKILLRAGMTRTQNLATSSTYSSSHIHSQCRFAVMQVKARSPSFTTS